MDEQAMHTLFLVISQKSNLPKKKTQNICLINKAENKKYNTEFMQNNNRMFFFLFFFSLVSSTSTSNSKNICKKKRTSQHS